MRRARKRVEDVKETEKEEENVLAAAAHEADITSGAVVRSYSF